MSGKFSIDLDNRYSSFLEPLNRACEHLDNAAYYLINTGVQEEAANLSEKLHGVLNMSATEIPHSFVEHDENEARQIEKGLSSGALGALSGLLTSPIALNLGRKVVGLEAWARAGANRYLFGHVLEIMSVNKQNINPFKRWTASLGKSSIATGQDIILTRGTVQRTIEAKAGTASYANTVLKRIKQGDYANCESMYASKEMYGNLKKLGAADDIKLKNTKISNQTLKKAADASGVSKKAKVPQGQRKVIADSMKQSASKAAMVKSGVIGAVIGGGIEALCSYGDYKNGNISGGEYANGIAREAVAGAVSGVASMAVGAAAAAAGAGAIAVAATGIVVGAAVSVGVSALWNELSQTGVPQITDAVSSAYETGKVDLAAIADNYVDSVGNAVVSSAEKVVSAFQNVSNVGDVLTGVAAVVSAPIEIAAKVVSANITATVSTVASAAASIVSSVGNFLKKW